MLRQDDGVGNYRIVRSIGAGAAGDVYEAFDTKLNRSVALKILPNEEAVLREARAAAKLDHPNILTVHDVGVHGEQAFLVTELVRGKTLRELLEEGKPPLDLAIQIAAGLAAAHAAGIVHRDLKPENVMVTEDGTVKILDFGIARLATSVSSESETEERGISGTVGYLAPEQAAGKPVDHRADVFSFGCVLYEMLSGRRPFPDVVALVRDEPKPLRAPEELRRLVERMLRKDPAQRLQSMADVRLLLEDGLERRPKRLGWKPALAAIAVAAAAAFTLCPRPRAPLVVTPVTSAYGREADPALSPNGRVVAFVWWKEDGEHPALYVKLVDSAAEPLQLADHAHAPAWSPDGERVAYLAHVPDDPGQIRHELRVVSALGGPESVLGRTLSGNHDLSWSPDGERIALLHREAPEEPDSIFIMHVEDGALERMSTPVDPDFDRSPRFSPGGDALVFVREGATFDLHLADGKAEPIAIFSSKPPIEGLDWTADGDELVYSADGRLWTIALDGKNPVPLAITGATRELSVARTRKPERLVYRLARSGKDIWSVPLHATDAGEARRLIGSTYEDYQPDVSPDGASIAFLSHRTGAEQIWTCTSKGDDCLALTTSPHDKMFPRWSPDARTIAYTQFEDGGGTDVYLLDVEGGVPARLTSDPAIDAAWSWSKDGEHLYFMSTRSGEHEVWRMTARGGDQVQLTEGGGFFPWEADDGYLYYKVDEEDAPMWRLPIAGGAPEPAIDARIWREPVLAGEKLFYLFVAPGRGAGLESINLTTREVETFTLLVPDHAESSLGTFAISPDGGTLVYVRRESEGGDLMLAENYRSDVR